MPSSSYEVEEEEWGQEEREWRLGEERDECSGFQTALEDLRWLMLLVVGFWATGSLLVIAHEVVEVYLMMAMVGEGVGSCTNKKTQW